LANATAVAADQNAEWRDRFKNRPVAWSLGAVGGGFLLGYAIAAIAKSESSGHRVGSQYAPFESHAYAAGPITGQAARERTDRRRDHKSTVDRDVKQPGPALLERFQQTEVYDHLRKEAVAVGRLFVGELSQTAQEVVLPVAVAWFRQWLTELASETTTGTTANQPGATNPIVAGSGEKRAMATAGEATLPNLRDSLTAAVDLTLKAFQIQNSHSNTVS
jgi:hypothetical protein